MVVALGQEGVESVLGGVTAGTVPTVVAQRDRLGQGGVRADPSGDRGSHLGHLEGVGEARPLVVGGEDVHLGLAGQTAKRGGVHDPVTVSFEAGAFRVGFLGPHPVPRSARHRGPRSQVVGLPRLALLAQDRPGRLDPGSGVAVRPHQRIGDVPGHGVGPGDRPRFQFGHGAHLRTGAPAGTLAENCHDGGTAERTP